MIFEELSTLESTAETTPPAPKKTKIDRLLSFMENTETEDESGGIEENIKLILIAMFLN